MDHNDPRQKCRELSELFQRSPLLTGLGIRIRYDDEQRAVLELPHDPGLANSLGGVHGGVVGTLLDAAGWFTAAVHYDTWIATVEFHVRLLDPVGEVDLWATAQLLRVGKRFAIARMEARTAAGKLVATGSGTFAVTSVPLPAQ